RISFQCRRRLCRRLHFPHLEIAMSQIIEVIVSPAGTTTVQTHGFVGATCQAASQALEQALGTVAAERKTTEFYTALQADQHLQQ
ncbi:MAG TPA: DUF2997 domain-containing protein, partial [Pirellulales bacterium]